MSKPNAKVLEAARKYLFAHAVWCQTDCSDSYDDMKCWRHTYDFIAEDKTAIEQFIITHLADQIPKAKAYMEDLSGEKWNNDSSVAPFLKGLLK